MTHAPGSRDQPKALYALVRINGTTLGFNEGSAGEIICLNCL